MDPGEDRSLPAAAYASATHGVVTAMIRCRARSPTLRHPLKPLVAMDRKGILVLIISLVLLILWFPLVNRLFPPIPVPLSTNSVTQVDGTNPPPTLSQPSPAPSVGLPLITNTPVAKPSSPAHTETLENDRLSILITSHGGGIEHADLKNHPLITSCGQPNLDPTNRIMLNLQAPLPLLTLLGGPDLQGDGAYTLSRQGNAVRAEKLLDSGLRVVKEFRIASNYLIQASVRFENTTNSPLPLSPRQWITGTATPLNAKDKGMYMGVYWYNGLEEEHVDKGWFDNRFLGCFPGTPRPIYQMPATVHWTAVHNQFYTLATIPDSPASQIIAVQTNLPPPSPAKLQADAKIVRQPTGFIASLTYPATNLLAGAVMEQSFLIYAGPKEYNALARLGDQMGNHLDYIMGYRGFFGFFAKMLLLSMNGIHNLGLSYGLSIIVITVIIKTLFWPLTAASTRSMKRMAALQPQMKALQEKFKDDPVKMNRKLMEFMKEHKVSPLGGCLPMLLQIPVFFGFYRMILSATELRGAQFLWACDLSQPDTLFMIPILNYPFNPLPLIMGATMLWQARLTPASPSMDPTQQKIMKYMPLMFLVILYNFSAGLTLYWTVQNILTIIQTKLTRTKDDPAIAAATATTALPHPGNKPRPKGGKGGRKRK